MCDRSIESLRNCEELHIIEKNLYPGNSSIAGFLGLNEKLLDIYEQDLQTIKNHNITFEQIADKLELIYQRGERCRDLYRSGKFKDVIYFDSNIWYKVDNSIAISFDVMQTMGYQDCPFYIGSNTDNKTEHITDFTDSDYDSDEFLNDNTKSECYRDDGMMFKIMNTKTVESIHLNKLIIHLIRNHNFFEGVESPYRVDPGKTISILGIKQGEQNVIKYLSEKYWVNVMASSSCTDTMIFWVKYYALDTVETESYTIYLVNELFCDFFGFMGCSFDSAVKSIDKNISLEDFIKSNKKWVLTKDYEEHVSDIDFFRKNRKINGKTLCLFLSAHSDINLKNIETDIEYYGLNFPKSSLRKDNKYIYRISEKMYVPLKDEN